MRARASYPLGSPFFILRVPQLRALTTSRGAQQSPGIAQTHPFAGAGHALLLQMTVHLARTRFHLKLMGPREMTRRTMIAAAWTGHQWWIVDLANGLAQGAARMKPAAPRDGIGAGRIAFD